jgi:hypothetical protein
MVWYFQRFHKFGAASEVNEKLQRLLFFNYFSLDKQYVGRAINNLNECLVRFKIYFFDDSLIFDVEENVRN